jgi:hypothetical protein
MTSVRDVIFDESQRFNVNQKEPQAVEEIIEIVEVPSIDDL